MRFFFQTWNDDATNLLSICFFFEIVSTGVLLKLKLYLCTLVKMRVDYNVSI